MLNVLVFNGGRGAKDLIKTLLQQKGINLTSVVNAYDDGKSTGEIRRFFSMLGPSDIRKVQELMLRADDSDYETSLFLFNYRFSEGISHQLAFNQLLSFAIGKEDVLIGHHFHNQRLLNSIRACLLEFLQILEVVQKLRKEEFNFSDCSIMNCIYAGAYLLLDRNFEKATLFLDRLFKLKGTVLATNNENKNLVALRENGEVLYSEAEIVELRSNVQIEQIYLLDQLLQKDDFERLSLKEKRYYLARHHSFVEATPAARLAIKQADIIIYSAGTQHSSLYPTYLSKGIAEEIANNHQALKIFLSNIGADYETPRYNASDYIKGAYRYLNLSDKRSYQLSELMDYALVNDSEYIASYDNYVPCDIENLLTLDVKIINDNFESESEKGKHNGGKVMDLIMKLYDEKQTKVYFS